MNSLAKAITRSSDISEMARTEALQMKGGLDDVMASAGDIGGFSGFRNQGRYSQQYSLFRGWLFSAINALAKKAAGQGVNLAKFTKTDGGKSNRLSSQKQFLMSKMTSRAHSRVSKSPKLGVELLQSSPLLDALEKPNDIQDRWQFVYLFVSNLALTGWGFIIFDTNDEGELQLFSIPTTWITPKHKEGKPFDKFVVRNPRRADVKEREYDNSQVAFAYLPAPSDPLSAFSPASAQMETIKIDDKILSSQYAFFENGIFPSVIVTVGHNPHPDGTPGFRPRLTATQRRQVFGVINKTMRGVTNYGNPGIVDGYIEKISPFSRTQPEMGWKESEQSAKTRILSAYSVHPYILGESVSVGGYAQVAGIERVFCEQVNTYLDMLGNVLSNKLIQVTGDEKYLVWWDKCEPLDPNIRNKMLEVGRKNNDITRNEFRAELGFPPMEEGSDRSRLVGDQVAMSSLLNALGKQGMLNSHTLAQLLRLFLGVTEEEANNIAGAADENETQELLEEMRNMVLEMKKPVRLEIDNKQTNKTVDDLLNALYSN